METVNARGRDLDDILKDTDIILIPMLPSAIDIRASGRFIADLLTHRLYRAAPRPVGVIANRVNTMNKTYNKLMQFLSCLDVPVVAQFNDSTLYTDAAEQGLGVIEMADDSARARGSRTVAPTHALGSTSRPPLNPAQRPTYA